MNTLWKFLFHFIVAIAIFALAAWAYSTVLPGAAALTLALVLGFLEIVSPAFSKHGVSMRLIARAGLPLLLWPLFGLLFARLLLPGRPWITTMLLASLCASATGFSTHAHAQGRDTQGRITESTLAVAIPLYALVTALVLNAAPVDMALAAAGAGVACVVTYQSRTWPGRHETALLVGAAACGATAAAWLLAAGVALI